jgi:hypothetical protein
MPQLSVASIRSFQCGSVKSVEQPWDVHEAGCVRLGPIDLQHTAFHDVVDRLRNVGRVVAHALEVLAQNNR